MNVTFLLNALMTPFERVRGMMGLMMLAVLMSVLFVFVIVLRVRVVAVRERVERRAEGMERAVVVLASLGLGLGLGKTRSVYEDKKIIQWAHSFFLLPSPFPGQCQPPFSRQ